MPRCFAHRHCARAVAGVMRSRTTMSADHAERLSANRTSKSESESEIVSAAAIGALDAKLVQRQLEPSPLDSQRTKVPASARAAATRAFAAGLHVGIWCRLFFRRQSSGPRCTFIKQRSQKFREWASQWATISDGNTTDYAMTV
jgi:hypothetical protein